MAFSCPATAAQGDAIGERTLPHAAQPGSADEAIARRLAEEWKLEYREAHSVAVDPRALALVDGEACRRLRVAPLTAGAGGPVVAVAEPSEERFAGVRMLTGDSTRFVVISGRTLDALLGSRMFGARPARVEPAEPAAPEPERPEPPALIAPAPEPHPALPTATQPLSVDPQAIASAILEVLEPRLPLVEPPPEPVAPDLLSQLDSSLETWARLRDQFATAAEELEEARRALRETKEQLSVAHAELDQHRRRIAALETEVAESRVVLAGVRRRLDETMQTLEGDTAEHEDARSLL